MAGHVFVVRGDLGKLACDGWLIPCNHHASPSGWFPKDYTGPQKGKPFVDGGPRVQRLQVDFKGQPELWLGWIGGWDKPINWYVDGAIEFLAVASKSLEGQKPLFGRSKQLLALPLVGTGRGGAANRAGDVVDSLLPQLNHFVANHDVDVGLVCWSSSNYAAAQAVRERIGIWPA